MSWLQILLASIHYIAFGLGLWAIFERGRCFKRLKKSPSESESLQKALFYDNLWAIAAILIIGTGLVKAFGHIEKPSEFYLKNGLFHAKLTLVFVIVLAEIYPMLTLIKLRIQRKKTSNPALGLPHNIVSKLSWINSIEAHIFVLIPFIAAAIARGVGLR